MITYDTKSSVKLSYAQKDYSYSDGKSAREINEYCRKCFENKKENTAISYRAEAIKYILENARLHFCEEELFVYGIEYDGVLADIRYRDLAARACELDACAFAECAAGYECGAFTGDGDFGHNCPDYSRLFELGIGGIISYAEEKERAAKEEKKEFYRSVSTVYKAIRTLILRYVKICERYKDKSDNARLRYCGLLNIADNPPANIYEALQLQMIVYSLMTHITVNIARTLGKLDGLLYRYYCGDINNGTFSQQDIRTIISNCLLRYYAMHFTANTPFYLCGSDKNGKDTSNELSRIILEEYFALDINDPKIQIRYHKNIPEDILIMAVKGIASGKNSIVFVNDGVIIPALEKTGASHEDACDYALVGCYEPLCAGKKISATCAGRIMLPKAIEYAFTSGFDFYTGRQEGEKTAPISEMCDFEDFYRAVKQQIKYAFARCVTAVNSMETQFPYVGSAPIFAPLLDNCMENGIEPYSGGAKYNNSSVNVFGVATFADSMLAVKRAVFEEKRLTLCDFYNILKENWNASEAFRAEILSKYDKYGNGNKKADFFARDIYSYCASLINGVPNTRGGIFRMGAFSIDWNHTFGAKLMATPDGRYQKTPMSKNVCASVAMDKKGITALINSATCIDYTDIPNGTVLDTMLHKSAMTGDDGMFSCVGLIKTFMALGGIGIQINVFDPSVLRKAQQMPEKYSNLQVRKCGWNVYFNELSREEQNEFIKQAENL